jgi:D-glycero-beta-D-manno-heptose 1-phosphate adenylyltransferase
MPLNKVLNKIIDLPEAESLMKVWKSQGKEVVFTNGCFDILHRGHVVYLAKAAGLGDKLMVAVNSDASVKRQGKGENRPINPAESRALLIAALGFVDAVIVFDQDTPFEVIKTLVPSVLVKGADYDAHCEDESNKKYIVGSKEVKEAGGSVHTIDLEEGYSTTNIIEKAKGR